MKVPYYRNNALLSLNSLARCLSISKIRLLKLADEADQFYLPLAQPKLKSDGSPREVYRVRPYLKLVQSRILHVILHNVDWPEYLQGGIYDKSAPRDYISNARLHTNKTALFREDITNFFPSIKAHQVEAVWRYCFLFSKDVARVLTKLTTYRGLVPQGASTSTCIGNLVFWDVEPQLEEELRLRGFCYSRYIDDITVSTNRPLGEDDGRFIKESIRKMLARKGMKSNPKKSAVEMNHGRMKVHNLNVNAVKPTVCKEEEAKIRAAVKQLEHSASNGTDNILYKRNFDNVYGRVQTLGRTQSQKAQLYLERLQKIKPTLALVCHRRKM